jgi:hypothetical protein
MSRPLTYFTLEDIIKIQPLTKLQATLTFIDYSIVLETFKIDKRRFRGFSFTS